MRFARSLLVAPLCSLVCAASCSSATSAPAGSATPYAVKKPPLDTDWTYTAGTNPWPQHPRPQLHRDAWASLNGIWTFRAADAGAVSSPPVGQVLDAEVLIPSCVESGLSGIQQTNVTYMWFRTEFDVPSEWSKDNPVLLNFEAVDYQATVFVNGKQVGTHTGGYFRFTFDVSQYLNSEGKNELLVFVFDPTDAEVIPVGKQTNHPSHIWYTPCSGIWQTVWLESAPSDHVTQLDVAAGADGTVTVFVHSSGNSSSAVEISVINKDGSVLASHSATSDAEFTFQVDSPSLWFPDSPTLYNLTVKFGDDTISSYTGFRTVSTGIVDGVQRPLLNGEFVFQFGTLDQGFWPDGIYLAPNYDALVFDLHVLKDLGFNMLRKHIKVEPDLFYHACDQIGLMLFQDMPSLGLSRLPNADEQAEFQRQLEILINEHKSYTSIVTWIIYNEGWGQLNTPPYPEFALTDIVRSIDPSRLIDSVTGWNDHGAGDYSDNHHYANPQCGTPFYSIASSPYDPKRIGIQGEFGGIGHNVTIEHLWNVQEAIDTINQTYELNADLDSYNYRAKILFSEFRDQVQLYSCSGGVWTQTTDVEGEVNGLVTYDRRLHRPYADQWKADIQSLYDAASARGGYGNATQATVRA